MGWLLALFISSFLSLFLTFFNYRKVLPNIELSIQREVARASLHLLLLNLEIISSACKGNESLSTPCNILLIPSPL